jgi:hypothetical protein
LAIKHYTPWFVSGLNCVKCALQKHQRLVSFVRSFSPILATALLRRSLSAMWLEGLLLEQVLLHSSVSSFVVKFCCLISPLKFVAQFRIVSILVVKFRWSFR